MKFHKSKCRRAMREPSYPFTVCRSFFLAFAVLVYIALPASASEPSKTAHLPFHPGEKLVFRLKWSFIPAGEAVLSVLPVESLDGEPVLHFVMTARTNDFVDAFYKVRDKIDSFVDLGMTHTVLYRKKQHEGNTKRNVVVRFDWEKGKAQYTTDDETREPIDIYPGSFDPLSVFYRIRLLGLSSRDSIEHPVTDGKKSVIGKARIVKRETLKLPSGTYDTYLIEPDLKHVGGVFKKSKNAKIKLWVTADRRHLPVKIKSKVAVGSFVGELVSAEGI